MAGKVVALPIYGKGLYEASFDGLSANYSTNYSLTTLQDGELYVIPQAYDFDFDVKLMKVHVENLFNGNKFLGDNMNTFLNENWRLVIDDLGKPMSHALGSIVHRILSNIYKKIPFKEMFAE
ncbi:Protein takeout [Zootermopsis nevadensis]|uniref:Protein takeout n=1 Tax=Zootermopsis nevadensis TaxID=136037 RepID=A0A067RAS7_ZOONE|nr:Protein takeout [Zootermopsis nevadensis]